MSHVVSDSKISDSGNRLFIPNFNSEIFFARNWKIYEISITDLILISKSN